MISYLDDGRLLFQVHAPDADSVELVGAFSGWDEEHYRMTRRGEGIWQIAVDPGPGCHLFRYLVDDRVWQLDSEAHGCQRSVDGRLKSRAWRPPSCLDPDELAA